MELKFGPNNSVSIEMDVEIANAMFASRLGVCYNAAEECRIAGDKNQEAYWQHHYEVTLGVLYELADYLLDINTPEQD